MKLNQRPFHLIIIEPSTECNRDAFSGQPDQIDLAAVNPLSPGVGLHRKLVHPFLGEQSLFVSFLVVLVTKWLCSSHPYYGARLCVYGHS